MKSYTIKDKYEFAQKWDLIGRAAFAAIDGEELVVSLGRAKRTISQNKKLWPLLRDIAKQLTHEGELQDAEFWKYALMAAYRPVRWINGLDGARIPFVEGSSKLTRKEFAEFLEVVYSYGHLKGVEFSQEAMDSYNRWKI